MIVCCYIGNAHVWRTQKETMSCCRFVWDSVIRDKLETRDTLHNKHTLAMLRFKDLHTTVMGHIIHNVLWPLSGYNTQSG